VTDEPCASDLLYGLETRVLDYVTFEEPASTPGNLKLLELSPSRGYPWWTGSKSTRQTSATKLGRHPAPHPVAPVAGDE